MIIYLDIETIPSKDPLIIDGLSKEIKAPGNIKKQESIDLWMSENYESKLSELVSKTSFDGGLGSIACVCFKIEDEDCVAIHDFESDSDAPILERLFYDFSDFGFRDVKFCGHNIHGFDLPFLKHRAIINGIKPPEKLLTAMNAKSWDSCIEDTMLMWSTDKQKMISLDRLCKVLGIPGKGDFDGSMVANEWLNGSKQKVVDYCIQDVEKVSQVHRRLTFS